MSVPIRSPDQLKHPIDDDDDDDDNVSLVSRSPSPPPMSDTDVYKYDEYLHAAPREVITVDTKIKPTNKGFAMLAKLGWTEGQPLGISGDGRVDPIPFQIKRDLTGLGKTSQDVRMIETTVSQRRGLDSERQQKESEDQRRAREVHPSLVANCIPKYSQDPQELVARKSALETELSSTLKAFYCSLCDKQFKNVAQYDEHTNSYAHHHKARYKDMQANVRLKPKDEMDKRKEKERKREEKELRKIAAANGIKMAKPTTVVAALAHVNPPSTSMDIDPSPPPKKGWATVSNPAVQQTGPRTGGWASAGTQPTPSHPIPTSSNATPPTTSTTGQPANPTFRTAGWTSLPTGSLEPMPPILSPTDPSSPTDHTAQPSRGGWSGVANSSAGWAVTQPLATPPPPPAPQPPALPAQPARSGWQQFQKSGLKRR
ncbi:hypothetical protein C0991_008738 [Blastosporella zonata]|nr:hypothetical protein C0991_008738 [Blastosporella zonata]